MKQTRLKIVEAPVRSNRWWQERLRAKALLHHLGAEMRRMEEEKNDEHR